MNVTNKQFEALEALYNILPCGDDFNRLDESTQEIIVSYSAVLVELVRKRKKDNKRIAEYIANKRRENKDYAR